MDRNTSFEANGHVKRLVASLLCLASCKGCDETASPRSDASTPAPVTSASSSLRVIEAGIADAGAPDDAAAFSPDLGDAGTSACRLGYGPAEQPFRGPASILVLPNEIRLVTNDSGKPRLYPVPVPTGAQAVVPPRPLSFVGMRWPACEIAGSFVYCQGPGGMIYRSNLHGGGEAKQIVKSRPGTRIAAAAVGAEHAVVAYLDLRHTTEGDMLQAFAVLDEGEPVKISDDGAGATTVRFLPRGETPVALTLDSRTAMVPVHARPLGRKPDGTIAVSPDTVVFVGGAPERGIDFTAVSAGAKGFALVPLPKDSLDFGMASLPIEDPPKEDVPATWSPYPNGIDPAPITAVPARDGKGAWVARVRPRAKDPGAWRVIELGRLDPAGVFLSLGEIARGKGVTDIAIAEDATGGVWILYGDTTVTWLERRVCPPQL